MFQMRDEKGPDNKILCVPAADPRMEHLQDIRHVPEFERSEIQHFFKVYKDLEPGKMVEAARWSGRASAEAEIERCRRSLSTALPQVVELRAGNPSGGAGQAQAS
jgi:inorganic pyrophosphatase